MHYAAFRRFASIKLKFSGKNPKVTEIRLKRWLQSVGSAKGQMRIHHSLASDRKGDEKARLLATEESPNVVIVLHMHACFCMVEKAAMKLTLTSLVSKTADDRFLKKLRSNELLQNSTA